MSAINQKIDPNKTKTLQEDEIALRGAIREAEAVLSLKDHPGWQSIQKSFSDRLSTIEEELDKFEKRTDVDVRMLLKERKDFRWISNVVDSVEHERPKLYAMLEGLQAQIEKRKGTSVPTHA